MASPVVFVFIWFVLGSRFRPEQIYCLSVRCSIQVGTAKLSLLWVLGSRSRLVHSYKSTLSIHQAA